MKLLNKISAVASLKKQNEDLIETNVRLRKYEKDIIKRLNTIKENYEPDKLKKLKEFEDFCKNLNVKKSKLLEELNVLEKTIELKKELFYGLVVKQDVVEEKLHNLIEQENKLDLRVAFVEELERRWNEKQLSAN